MKEGIESRILPKEEKMYCAVLDMISEGNDIRMLTVSAITKRAGIGKGTAYEYFKSKEELIGSALEWNFRTQLEELCEMVEKEDNFHDKVYTLLDWLEKKVNFGNVFRQTFRLAAGTEGMACCTGTGMKGKMKKSDYMIWINRVFDDVMDAGFREKVMNPDGSSFNRKTSLMSQLLIYFACLKKNGERQTENLKEIKDQIYRNLLLLNQ